MPGTRNSVKAALAVLLQGMVAGLVPHFAMAAVISGEGASRWPRTSSISSAVGVPGAGGRNSSGDVRSQVFHVASSAAPSWRSRAAAAAVATSGRDPFRDATGRSAAPAMPEPTTARRENRVWERENIDMVGSFADERSVARGNPSDRDGEVRVRWRRGAAGRVHRHAPERVAIGGALVARDEQGEGRIDIP